MLSKDEGPLTARYVLVGEAYGTNEADAGRPFVGASYRDKLLPWWRGCDPVIQREQVYITNTWDYGVPERGIDRIPEYEMRAAMERCRQRVEKVVGPDGDGRGPYVIVVTGNYALYTFTGNGRVSFHHRDGRHERPGILDWRGSIFVYRTNDGREIKVIATPHPAATFGFRNPGLEWVCRKDWQRIAEDGQFREARLPSFTKMVGPSFGEVKHWIEWTRAEADKKKNQGRFAGRMVCSADVETPKQATYKIVEEESKAKGDGVKCRGCGHTRRWHEDDGCSKKGMKRDGALPCLCGLSGGFTAPMSKPKRRKESEEAYLGCIGYCWDPKLAVCIPTTLKFWQDPEVYQRVMGLLRDFHADRAIDFGGQNFGFDAWWCAKENIPLWSIAWDLMKMHRVQRPWSQWHDLAFQASIDTRHPFWKHEAKLPDELTQWANNNEQLWSYNCDDNWVQLALLFVRLQTLATGGRLDYYMQMEAPIDDELLPMSLHGFRADIPGRQAEFANLMEQAAVAAVELNEAAGTPIVNVAKKTGAIVGKKPSDKKLKELLYREWRLPPQMKVNAQRVKVETVDIVAIKRLMERFPGHDQLQKVGTLVLRHRRLTKKASDLKDSRVEADGRVYAIFKQDTLLGRLSSSATPKKEGQNLQNVDHELRRFFLPDTGEERAH